MYEKHGGIVSKPRFAIRMEGQPNQEIKRPQPEQPKTKFVVDNYQIDLADVLTADPKKRMSQFGLGPEHLAPEKDRVESAPGSSAAGWLVRELWESQLTIEEYREATPHLLKYAQDETGKFDAGLIGVFFRVLNRNAKQMGLGLGSW